MKIVYLKLVNFIGVKAATGLNEIEFKYEQMKQPIIQIYGKNRCGKTVMIQQHHPFSSINLTGDERGDLSLIIPGEIGCKKIVYEIHGQVYVITHTYRPTGKSHTVSSSIVHNGQELNPTGGVTSFNTLIEKIMGINKYVFQFIINGTNLTSFAGMGMTQRKNLLNKAMGIDIYDKIHKLATEDYRFTNKLITSLNQTKEFLLQTYGSYETLFATLDSKRSDHEKLLAEIQQMKSGIDALSGTIRTIEQQNPEVEMHQLNSQRVSYKNAVDEIGGTYDPTMHDQLVDEQIQLNQRLSQLKADRQILMNEIDGLYEKKHNIESVIQSIKKAKSDYEEMERVISGLKEKIDSIHIELQVGASSQFMFGMLSVAQSINTSAQEIVSSLTHEHLEILVKMVLENVDVAAVLMTEGASLMDSEKEKSIISYIHSMLQSVEGDIPDECNVPNCLYRKQAESLQTYFKAFHATSKGKFTRYDLEQMDHAYKNVQTIRRLISMDLPDDLREMFNIRTIMKNLLEKNCGVDVTYLKYMIEEATKQEQLNQYIKQYTDSQATLEVMKQNVSLTIDTGDDTETVTQLIRAKEEQKAELERQMEQLSDQIADSDRKRMMIASIQKIDINAVETRYAQLFNLVEKLNAARLEHAALTDVYRRSCTEEVAMRTELDKLEKAFDQFVKTTAEIERHMENDTKFKAIAEATSSTKGIPVLAIRDTVDRAINTANRLLNVMYDGEIELLRPVIDESQFTLPFRCGSNQSADIKYGSQSESTLLSLALSLSLASSMTQYNIPLVDEIDAYLDSSIRDDFILMLSNMMASLGMEQMFLISHNLQKDQLSHIVSTVDMSEIIKNMR